jgi:flagellar biosynthesis/type III secretory pathway ATPase
MRELVAAYADIEDMVSIGAYKSGSKPVADDAIAHIDQINDFLKQGKTEASDYQSTLARLSQAVNK